MDIKNIYINKKSGYALRIIEIDPRLMTRCRLVFTKQYYLRPIVYSYRNSPFQIMMSGDILASICLRAPGEYIFSFMTLTPNGTYTKDRMHYFDCLLHKRNRRIIYDIINKKSLESLYILIPKDSFVDVIQRPSIDNIVISKLWKDTPNIIGLPEDFFSWT